jgi:hypothetical protein
MRKKVFDQKIMTLKSCRDFEAYKECTFKPNTRTSKSPSLTRTLMGQSMINNDIEEVKFTNLHEKAIGKFLTRQKRGREEKERRDKMLEPRRPTFIYKSPDRNCKSRSKSAINT